MTTIDSARFYEAAELVHDRAKRDELLYYLALAEKAHERAQLEDMGYDNCEVCRANRIRESWETP